MPPKRTIHVDTNRILTSIAEQAAEQHTAALERTATYRDQERVQVLEVAAWVPRNLEALAGKPLTPSERIRHQQAMRKLEADGLVRLDTVHVRLTEAGRAFVDRWKSESATPNG